MDPYKQDQKIQIQNTDISQGRVTEQKPVYNDWPAYAEGGENPLWYSGIQRSVTTNQPVAPPPQLYKLCQG